MVDQYKQKKQRRITENEKMHIDCMFISGINVVGYCQAGTTPQSTQDAAIAEGSTQQHPASHKTAAWRNNASGKSSADYATHT